jgi:hypothetical protein
MLGTLAVAPNGGGDVANVDWFDLRCHGARWRVVEAQIYSTDPVGTLAFNGVLCRSGPRPKGFEGSKGKTHRRPRHCCPLGGGTFTHGPIRVYAPPPEYHVRFLPEVTHLTSFTMTTTCAPPVAVDLHDTTPPTTTAATTTTTSSLAECAPATGGGPLCTTTSTVPRRIIAG